MATKRFSYNRHTRHFILYVISFLLGVMFNGWFLCSEPSALPCINHDITQRYQVECNRTLAAETNNTRQKTTATSTTVLPATKEPYPPILNNKDLMITPKTCPDDLFLLVVVITSSRNFEARNAIRRSWGEDSSKMNETSLDSFRLVYVLGSDGENDRLIAKEAKRYRDILRGSFRDVYRQNNEHTVKMLLGFKWASQSCKARFILRVSSESFVNVPEIMKSLKEKTMSGLPVSGIYMGFCHGLNTGGANVVRNPSSPWYISEHEWSDQYLPPYASSIGIVLSFDVVEQIVTLSIKEKLVHIDDVYLGIMATKLSIKCQDEASRFDTSYTTMFAECEDLGFSIVGSVPYKDMFYLNQNVKNLKEICTK